MAKHLKLRIYRAIIGSLQSCRFSDPSDLPENPVPLLSKPLNDKTHARRRRVFSAGGKRITSDAESDAVIVEPRRKICRSSEEDAPPAKDHKKRISKKRIMKKRMSVHFRASTSSAESAWFSSETLVSSTDSSTKWRRRRRSRKIRRITRAAGAEIPARLSVFKKLIPCSVEGKVKESFAVVKRSEDPHEDFKSSMLDMILEKQMFDREDLEQLLECFLSLNSKRYHGVIVQAFSEVWQAVFSPWTDSSS